MPVSLIGESNLIDLIDGAGTDPSEAGYYSYRRVMGQNFRSFDNQKMAGTILPCHDIEPAGGGRLVLGHFDTDIYTWTQTEAENWLLGF